MVMSITDANQIVRQDPAGYCRNAWGGGTFVMEIFDDIERLRATYTYPVGGALQYYPLAKGSGDSGNGTGTGGGGSNKQIIEFLMAERADVRALELKKLEVDSQREARLYEANAQRDERYIQLIAGNNTGGLQDEITSLLINNYFTDKQNSVANMREVMQLAQSLQPQVQGEDTMTQMLGMVTSIATAFLSRGTSATPALAQNAVSSYIDKVPKEEIAAMLANKSAEEITEFIGQLTGTVAPGLADRSVSLPPPGAPAVDTPQAEARQTGSAKETKETPAEPGEDLVPAGISPAVPGPPDPHLKVTDKMIDQFRADVRARSPVSSVAMSLLGIVSYATSMVEPPEVLRGLVEVTEETFLDVFSQFCERVPELAGDPEYAEALRDALIDQLVAVHESHVEAAGASEGTQIFEQEIDTDYPDSGEGLEDEDAAIMGRGERVDADKPEGEDQEPGGGSGGETEAASQIEAA
jgi:hypothetical protein